MYRKLVILLWVVIATQLPMASFASEDGCCIKSNLQGSYSELKANKAPAADLVYQLLRTAVRSISIQKDSSFTSYLSVKPSCPLLNTTAAIALQETLFSKKYIDHIYPSHHFW